jgi:membrane-associated protease RseP (regulator of RpoE activity)
MRRIAISMRCGGVAALFAAGALQSAGGQNPAAPPRAVKDTLVLRLDGTKITMDSLRVLMRIFEGEPLSSMQSARIRREIDAAAIGAKIAAGLAGSGSIVVAGPDGIRQFGAFPAKGWIGLTTAGMHREIQRPDAHLVQYVDYPSIVSVERRGPAQLAGILPGDTLVAYDGVDVVAHPINMAQLLTPERKLDVTVRREGETRAFTLVVGRAPNGMFTRRVFPGEGPGFPFPEPTAAPVVTDRMVGAGPNRIEIVGGNGPGDVASIYMFSTNGVFGASMSQVGSELAKVWKIEPGVLVNDVPEDTPAYRAGLKAGDVILSVSGQPVASVNDVRKAAILRGENHTVTLQILRDKKTRAIIVR